MAETLDASVAELTGTLAKLEVRGLVSRRGVGYEITGSGARTRQTAVAGGDDGDGA
jgi:hypothetical protein